MISMPYGNCNVERSNCLSNVYTNNEEPPMKGFGLDQPSKLGNMYTDILSIQKAMDLEMPDMRKLNMSSDNQGLANFMMENAKSGRDTQSIKVKVPTSEHVAEIVGKQGCKIKSLRYSTKTYIQTPARDQEPVFTISGYPEDVERAKRRIEDAADHFTKIRQGRENSSPITPQLGPNAVVRYVRVPLKYVGLVVGPKGHNIKRIQSETDTFIMTPARDKEPIFEIRGAAEKVEEAENKLQGYIAMRTGGMFDDSDHLVDVDLKKPMLPPKPLDGFPTVQPSFVGNKAWPGSNLYTNFGFGGMSSSGEQHQVAQDSTRIDADSGYSSPNYDRNDLQNWKLLLEHIMNVPQQQFSMQQQQQQPAPHFPSNRWSHSSSSF